MAPGPLVMTSSQNYENAKFRRIWHSADTQNKCTINVYNIEPDKRLCEF